MRDSAINFAVDHVPLVSRLESSISLILTLPVPMLKFWESGRNSLGVKPVRARRRGSAWYDVMGLGDESGSLSGRGDWSFKGIKPVGIVYGCVELHGSLVPY